MVGRGKRGKKKGIGKGNKKRGDKRFRGPKFP